MDASTFSWSPLARVACLYHTNCMATIDHDTYHLALLMLLLSLLPSFMVVLVRQVAHKQVQVKIHFVMASMH